MIRLVRHHKGPRLYVGGLRLHHGLAATIGSVVFQRSPIGRALCGAAQTHDAPDFPWLSDRRNH